MLNSKQLAERAALMILDGRRVLVAVPETERARAADLCWEAAKIGQPGGVLVTRALHTAHIEACPNAQSKGVGPCGRVDFISDPEHAQGLEFDEFLYHQATPAATIEALLPLLGRGLELVPAEEVRLPTSADLLADMPRYRYQTCQSRRFGDCRPGGIRWT